MLISRVKFLSTIRCVYLNALSQRMNIRPNHIRYTDVNIRLNHWTDQAWHAMTIWFLKVCFKIKSAPIKFVASSTIVNLTAYIGTLAIFNCNINQMILFINYDVLTKNLYWRYTTDEEGWGWGVSDHWVQILWLHFYVSSYNFKGFYLYFYLNDKSNCFDKYRFDCMYHTCISLLIF